MNLYKIEDASTDTKGFAWASGFGPLSQDMPFLHPKEYEMLKEFWKVNRRYQGISIDSGGRYWPDFLGSGSMGPEFFVSQKILDSLYNINSDVARATEMPIAEIKAKPLKSKPAPKYYVIETIPGIEVDLLATGFQINGEGKAIVNPAPNPWPSPYRYKKDSWNGSDLFAYKHFGPTDGPYTNLFCTEKIVELAKQEGWTNVRFKPLELS